MTHPSDIAGLSERLRIVDSQHYGKTIHFVVTREDVSKAATALDSLTARVKELEAALGCKQSAIAEFITGDDKSDLAQARASEAYMSGALSREIELCQAAESRALRAEQQRDEAYERLKPFAAQADLWPDLTDDTPISTSDGECTSALDFKMLDLRAARDLVRRLASGPEGEPISSSGSEG